MDGDEEQRSGAVAVCDGATEDGAEESGDAAPSDAVEDPRAAGSAAVPADVDAVTADAPTDDAPTDDATEEAPPDETPGGSADAEDASAAVTVEDGEATDEPELTDATVVLVGAERVGSTPRRLGPYVRRGAVALVAVGLVALAVSAFARVVPSLEGANERFVEAAQSRGHVIVPGEQQTLVLSAARKICDRMVTHDTVRERRSTALTSAELAAVDAVFGAETRDFTALALDAYCYG